MSEHEDPGASHTRELIAATVASDPDRFNTAMLGRPNADYVQWIMKTESWGISCHSVFQNLLPACAYALQNIN